MKITNTVSRGFYYFAGGRHYIAISSKIPRSQRTFVGWHEFAHFLQNFYARKPIAAFSAVEPDRGSEKLADVFAIIALRPEEIRIAGPQDFIQMLMTSEEE